MYELRADRPNRRVTLTFSGVMDQDPKSFFAELTGAATFVRGTGNDWDLLVDFTGMAVMNQERAGNTAKIYNWCCENEVRKVACVTQSITQRMQLTRLTGNGDIVSCFETQQDAQAWLNEARLREAG